MVNTNRFNVLDHDGRHMGILKRDNLTWVFEVSGGGTRKLFSNMNKSLLAINSNVKWMEQLTHFGEVK
jgi:hypothetical protein